ncbi:MAG: phoB [Armatimonadetes bacterium]|nr:phoB [Armatimonadota bacterium]
MSHILLVDDELVLRTSLSFTLQQHGYRVTTAADGPTALLQLANERPDLLVLDLMLPGIDGLEVCRRLRKYSQLPLIMLTAKGQEIDKIQGLRLGADDYVTKPFSSRELVARIEAVLRRHAIARELASTAVGSGPAEAAAGPVVRSQILEYGPLRLDLGARQAWNNETPLNLSPKEFQLLWVLMLHQGRALSRAELISSVWGETFMGDLKTLDVHIRWLRAKIEPDPHATNFIHTVRRFGFRLG